jgi:hypothetical protein
MLAIKYFSEIPEPTEDKITTKELNWTPEKEGNIVLLPTATYGTTTFRETYSGTWDQGDSY